MNSRLTALRLPLFCCFCVASALTLAFHFVPWRFLIEGYRFPYHGRPSLVIDLVALCFGIFGTIRNWAEPKVKWPWLATIVLVSVQLAFLIGFLQGPDVAIGKGKTIGPLGETPIEIPFDISPLWGVYAAVISSLASLMLAVLSLLANRSVAEPSDARKSPDG